MLLEEWNLGDAVAFAKEDGMRKRTLDIAKKMKANGKSIDEIILITELTVDDILRL